MKYAMDQNKFKLLSDGQQFFDEVIRSVDEAVSEVYLETYILAVDRSSAQVIEALLRARRRNVTVRVLIDGVGCSALDEAHLKLWRNQGLSIHLFRPLHKWYHLKQLVFRRLHRKVIVIDKNIAFVGGMNIHDEQKAQFDFTLRIEGPLAKQIHRYVITFYFRVSAQWFKYLRTMTDQPLLRNIRSPRPPRHFIVRDNIVHRNQIEEAYVNAIQNAEKEILIANAYFFPRRRFRRALVEAISRGVSVTLLLQGKTDVRLMKWASQSLYLSLLKQGVRIFEYERMVLHAKTAVIDRSWLTVGSANLDLFSLFLNLEANIALHDTSLANQLHAQLSQAIAEDSREIVINDLSITSRWQHLLARISLWILRLVHSLAGRHADEE